MMISDSVSLQFVGQVPVSDPHTVSTIDIIFVTLTITTFRTDVIKPRFYTS